jgi:cysteine desulfurase
LGQEAKAALFDAREKVAALINASPHEVIFTSGGTEADNLAILGVIEAAEGGRRHVVTSAVEHHAILNLGRYLAKKGTPVTFLKVDRAGVVDPQELSTALSPETLVVSIMHANNETGVIQPIEVLARLTRESGATFHTDAIQSVGKIPVDVQELGVDLLAISGHKIHGPKGVGALYVRRGAKLRSVYRGGGQERARRPGTENLPGIVGLGKAAELAMSQVDKVSRRLASLRDRIENDVVEAIPGVRINGEGAPRTPNTTNLSFEGVEAETLTIALDLRGFAVSTGAACSSGSVEPSHVLQAMGLATDRVQSSIRVSLSKFTTDEEVQEFVVALRDAVKSVRGHATGAKMGRRSDR